MASLSDVAKAAGVSLTTASLVLNRPKQPNRVSTACAERVRGVAVTLGYIPNYHARSMKLGRAETIAVAMDVGAVDDSNGLATVSELADGYFNQVMGGIDLHLRGVGYQMILVGPDGQTPAPHRGLEGLGQRRFDGMIVLCASADPAEEAAYMSQPDAAIVAIEYAGKTKLPVVDFDTKGGLELALAHLWGCKHKRLLWVGPGDSKREDPFAELASAMGLETRFCRFEFRPQPGRTARLAQVEQGRAAMRRWLAERPRREFTAVVAHNDPVALGAIGALAEAGVRVPRDVSVVGFDDVEAVFCIPGLTTVSHRLADLGKRSAEMVMEMVTDDNARLRLRGTREVLGAELVVRESTAASGE
jgi:LacI family transcriptional regulator